MDRAYGCAPIYFLGAISFLVGGGVFFYFDHPIIGTVVGLPGVILLGLTLLTLLALSQIKKRNVDIFIKDEETGKILVIDKRSENEPKIRKKKKR